MINLPEKKEQLIKVAREFFEKIVLSTEACSADRVRTGLQIFIRIPGDESNFIYESIENPRKEDMVYAIEKAIRSNILENMTSQDSRNPDKLEFSGSIDAFAFDFEKLEEYIVQVSVSGLKEEDDVALAISLMATIFDVHPLEIREHIEEHSGQLPEYFDDRDYHLFSYLN